MQSNKEPSTSIPVLEARLASNARSPSFARLAFCHLKEGHHQTAVDICLDGLKHFPDYATAHLVLGQCYEAMGRHIEAMLEYRRVLKNLPDNRAVQRMLEKSEQREQEAFRTFSENRSQKNKSSRETITFEKYEDDEGADRKESTAEFLLNRLRYVKKSVPAETRERPSSEEPPSQTVSPSKIVTATLAEIYASQGEYKEAIEAYKKLVHQRPIEAERYTQRIAQLEELCRMQRSEQQG